MQIDNQKIRINIGIVYAPHENECNTSLIVKENV